MGVNLGMRGIDKLKLAGKVDVSIGIAGAIHGVGISPRTVSPPTCTR